MSNKSNKYNKKPNKQTTPNTTQPPKEITTNTFTAVTPSFQNNTFTLSLNAEDRSFLI